MRLHRLEITGVGPFLEPQVIDFDPLMDAGLFLIDGPTGAGKTTIIDAVTFALFGTTSGLDSDIDRMRSDYCTAEDPTEVVLEFSVRGRRHRIARSPEYQRATKRKTSTGVTTQAARQNLTEYDADGEPILTLTAHADIGVHVRELLGMGASQFRQLVVLPQGEFANLLRMSPRDRLQSLATLLGSDFFDQVQTELVQRADAARDVRDASELRVEQALTALRTRTSELITHLPAHAEKYVVAISETDLDAVVAAVTTAAAAAADEDSVAVGIATAARQRLEHLQSAGAALTALRDARHSLDAVLAQLQLPTVNRDGLRHEQRQLAERIGVLRPLGQWEAGASDRQRALIELEEHVRAAAAEVSRLETQSRELPGQLRDAVRARDAAAELLRTAGDARQRADDANDRLTAAGALVDARTAGETLAAEANAATLRRGEAEARLTALNESLTEALKQQQAQRAALLASDLTDDHPCPVCGALEHPAPARPVRGAHLVDDAMVEAAQAKLADAQLELDRLGKECDAAITAAREQEKIIAALQGRVGTASEPELRAARDAAMAQLQRINDAERDMPELNQRVKELEHLETQQASELKAAQHHHAAAETSLATFANQQAEKLQEIAAVVGARSSAAEALSAAESHLALIDSALTAAAAVDAATAALPEDLIDAEATQRELVEAQRDDEDAAKRAEQVRARSVTLGNAVTVVRNMADEVRAAIKDRADVYQGVETVIRLAEIAAARSAANQRRLPLASYAVQLRFVHVLEAASIHLERMSAGQYSFELSTETSGRGLAGLGITMLDSWTGQSRDPRTLSGGETFYASLALALGLADVVQAETGGAQLETLFVDEGFGSLDADTLQLVLDQLDHLRSGGRVVGVISHVHEMKERIPDQVQVVAQPDHTSVIVQDLNG